MSDQTAPDYRKQLRHRVAFLTGLMAMREDLDSDIADLMNSMSSMSTNPPPQTGVRRGRPPKLITAASTITASGPEPEASNGADRPRGGAGWNTEQRKRQSATMKERWAAFKAGKTPVPPNTAGSVARTEIISRAITGRASKKAARKTEGKKIYQKVYTPIIGFGTNAEFIYERGMANNGLIRIHEVKAAAARSINHKNLAVGGRLTVTLAEMKRKSLIEHAEEKGEYRILPVAIRARQQELRAREQEQKKAS